MPLATSAVSAMSKTIGPVCLGNIARFRQQLRRLRKHETGGALIEFALVAPLLITLLVAVMEFAMVVLVMVLLEGGVREAARYGMTGQTPADSSRLEAIADIINDHSLGLIDVTTSDVDVLVYDDFSSVDSGDELVVDVKSQRCDRGPAEIYLAADLFSHRLSLDPQLVRIDVD